MIISALLYGYLRWMQCLSVYTLMKSCLGRVYRIDCQKLLNGGEIWGDYTKGLNNILKSSEIIIVKTKLHNNGKD